MGGEVMMWDGWGGDDEGWLACSWGGSLMW